MPQSRPNPRKKPKLHPHTPAPDEILFSPELRQDFLTGFHKRKVARIKHAREIAAKKEREERNRLRRERRGERRGEMERRVAEINEMIRGGVRAEEGDGGGGGKKREESERESGSEDGDEVFEEEEEEEQSTREILDQEDEYIDEERYTTVLIEEVDVDRDGLHKSIPQQKSVDENGETAAGEDKTSERDAEGTGKRKWTVSKPSDKKSKVKKKKFRYESKAERKVSREKERGRNKKAARARRERD